MAIHRQSLRLASALRRAACFAGLLLLAGTVRADDDQGILRFNPISKKLAPIAASDIKPGHIYNHFSPQLGRRVWSYVQAGGQFWNAFGEGTTQEAWRFDLVGTREELVEEAQAANQRLLETYQRGVQPVRFRLNSSSEWELVDTSAVLSIYNVETGQRWEKQTHRYLPVRTMHCETWTVYQGRYVPIGW